MASFFIDNILNNDTKNGKNSNVLQETCQKTNFIASDFYHDQLYYWKPIYRFHGKFTNPGVLSNSHSCWTCTSSSCAQRFDQCCRRKGGQVRFTTNQTDSLERRFQNDKYLTPEERKILAETLQLSDRQVKTWFQNRRAKWRRQRKEEKRN